jgi:hypothetical protein
MIKRASANFDQDLVRFYLRIGNFDELEHVRPTVLFEDDGTHGANLTTVLSAEAITTCH